MIPLTVTKERQAMTCKGLSTVELQQDLDGDPGMSQAGRRRPKTTKTAKPVYRPSGSPTALSAGEDRVDWVVASVKAQVQGPAGNGDRGEA